MSILLFNTDYGITNDISAFFDTIDFTATEDMYVLTHTAIGNGSGAGGGQLDLTAGNLYTLNLM